MSIYALPNSKCFWLVTVRSNHLSLKSITVVSVRSSFPCIEHGVRIELKKSAVFLVNFTHSPKDPKSKNSLLCDI